MKHLFCFSLLSLLIASCAGTLPYATDYPLTTEAFLSRDGILGGRLPRGWVYSSEDTLAPALLAWLVKEDFSAALTLQELHLDGLSSRQVESEGLELLARMSLQLQPDPTAVRLTLPPKEFKMTGRKFCGYEVISGGQRKRVIVFAARGRYFECRATPLKGVWTDEQLSGLFAAQQVLLSSLTF